MLTCPKCGMINSRQQQKCMNCQTPLSMELAEIQEIRKDLQRIKQLFEKETLRIENRLTQLSQRVEGASPLQAQEITTPLEKVYTDSFKELYELEAEFFGEDVEEQNSSPETTHTQPSEEVTTSVEEIKISEETEIEQPVEEVKEVPETPAPVQEEIPAIAAFSSSEASQEPQEETVVAPVKEAEPSWLFSLLMETIFAPFAQFKEYCVDIYMHYKKQNKLPVFFMTIGGVLTLLFGFGYWMQDVSGFALELTKTIVGFGAATGVLFWGKRLIKEHEQYQEFGSALFGFGISLNYLMLYFLADSAVFPFFQSKAVGLLMVLMNALLASWLALKYETKVVAVVSLLGGAFAPFYLNSDITSPFYFGYLWLLCGASIFIAKKIDWKPLGTTAFLVSALMLELVIWDWAHELSIPIFTIIFHAFTYLFVYYALFERKTPKFLLIKEEVFVLSVSISLLLLNTFLLYQSQGALTALGIVYLSNAIIWLTGFFLLRSQLPKRMHLLFFILAGTFIGLAIPVLFGQELAGLFWALEGIGLVACGFIFGMPSVRKEGYLVMLIAIGKVVLSCQEIFWKWETAIWHAGFINYLIIGGILLAIRALLYRFRGEYEKYEQRITYFCSETLSIWAWGVWFMLSWYYLGISTYNYAMIPLLALAWWGHKNKLKFTEWFGLANYVLFFLGFVLSTLEVNSFRFSQQTFLGKLSMIEIAIPLWGLQLFYEKLMPNSKKLELMKVAREVFYIGLPWVWLRGFYRHFPDYLFFGFWASSALSFGLSEVLKNKSWVFGKEIIRNQGYIAIASALIVPFATLPQLIFSNSLWNWGFVNLLLIGALLGSLKAYLDKIRTSITHSEIKLSKVLLEGISAWAMLLCWIISYYYTPEYAPLINLTSAFAWLWWAKREQLVATELLALSQYLIAFLFITVGMSEVGTISFLRLTVPNQLLQLMAYGMLWALPKFSTLLNQKTSSEYTLKSHGFLQLLKPMFFWLLPIIWMPTAWVEFHELFDPQYNHAIPPHFTLLVWGAVLMAFGLHRYRKHYSLNLELHFLTFLATLCMLFQVNYFSVGAGLVILMAIFFSQKALHSETFKTSPYRVLFSFTVYFVVLAGSLIYADVAKLVDAEAGIFLVTSSLLYLAVFFRKQLPPIQSTQGVAFRVGNLLHIGGTVLCYFFTFSHGLGSFIVGLLVLSNLALQGLMAHQKETRYLYPEKQGTWKFDVILFHLFTIAGYTCIGDLISSNWNGVVLTVLLTLHAIVLLFTSTKQQYKFLLRFAVSVFIAAALKLKFYDMANFPAKKQITVLMIVGVLLLIGANLFARFRKNVEEDSIEESDNPDIQENNDDE